jgi:hypothetical protein
MSSEQHTAEGRFDAKDYVARNPGLAIGAIIVLAILAVWGLFHVMGWGSSRAGFSPCRSIWDPAASAEAQALATAGALSLDAYGESALQQAQDGGYPYPSSIGLSDHQLKGLMHKGSAP